MRTVGHTNDEGRRGGGGSSGGASAAAGGTVSSRAFYGEYHGHTGEHLAAVSSHLRGAGAGPRRPLVWLAGDSTLDNKFWILSEQAPAANGMAGVLRPPTSVPDVAHWLNAELEARGGAMACVNTAVEESTLGQRRRGKALLPQDVFIRENVEEGDTVVVSVGGNDVALRPSAATVCAALGLFRLSTTSCVASGRALGLGHFVSLFGDRTRELVEALCAGPRKPKKVVVCALYYLDPTPGGSWADATLAALGYNSDPGHLQRVIREVFARATSRVAVEGVEVVPVPLYAALDGSDTRDYVQRVEPSSRGGRKMAALIADAVLGQGEYAPGAAGAAPEAERAMER